MPPPPSGGSGKYIIVVALLGAGLAALLFWKSCGPTQPVVVTPIPSATPDAGLPPNPIADDLPPPLPIEDAGNDAGHKVNVVSNGGASGCDQKTCSGGVTPDLETALAFRAKQAHRCYDAALAQDTTLQGRVTINVRVGANGQVCSAKLASNELSNPNVGNCIANMFGQAGHFPTPRGGCFDVNVPILLLPPGQR